VNPSIVGFAPARNRLQVIRFDGAALTSQQLGEVSEGFILMFITQTSRAYQIRFCGHCMVSVGHTYDDVEVAIQLWLLLTFSNTLCFAWLAIMLFEIHLVSNLARQLIVKGILCNSDHVYPLIKVLLPLATLAHRANHSAMLLL
jgi:hypothetical protein